MTTPRIAASNPADSKPAAAQYSVYLDRVEKIRRTRRRVAATRAWAADGVDDRGEKHLVAAN
jgi:hypothetical protein